MKKLILIPTLALAACTSPSTKTSSPAFQKILMNSRHAHAIDNEANCDRIDPKPLDYSFKRTDFNKDGVVSQGEFGCKSIHWFGQLDKNKDHKAHLASEVHADHHAQER